MRYQHLLAAAALDEAGETVIRKAQDLARLFGARLSVVHVVEYIPLETGEALMAAPPDLSLQLTQQAQARLRELCARLGVPADAVHVGNGSTPREIMRQAEALAVDLIVLGHHPRRGLAAWFSHTEEDVVQRAHCDVLAVKLD